MKTIEVLFIVGVFIVAVFLGIVVGLTLHKPEATIKSVEGTNDSYRIWIEVDNIPLNSDTFILHVDLKDILNAIDKYNEEKQQ